MVATAHGERNKFKMKRNTRKKKRTILIEAVTTIEKATNHSNPFKAGN
jgi:hypothetical protein